MKSFAVNGNNDLFIGPGKTLAIVTGVDAISQNCVTAVKAQRNEMVFAMNQGMPTRSTAWDKYSPSQFEAAVRSIILGVDGVTSIVSFALIKQDNVLTYACKIKTIYGIANVNG